MTELRVLNLEFNKFISFSVQGLINFDNLEVLYLHYNSITDVKAGDGLNTTKLKTLVLMANKLAATTRLDALKYMPMLQELDLSDNGFIDLDSLGLVLPLSLQVLSLASNKLSSIPKALKYMSNLQELDLSHNGFIDLDNLDLKFPLSLQVLSLASNQLSSTPKGYSKICRLTNLQELSLSINALTNMPYCLGNLRRLRTLDLSDNQLNGNLSFFVSGLPSTIEYLSLFGNNFNGSFWFNSLVNHTKLTIFELSSKVGTIQDLTESSWVPLFQLKRLTLQNFILDGAIHGLLLHQHDLCFVDLSHNKLTGAFPTWLVQNNTRLLVLKLDNNLLTEVQLPRLVHGLQVIDISSNIIYDSVQEDIGIVFPKLRYLNYSSNHFHGTIPSSMGEMKSLRIVDMSSNGLYGQLPKPFLSNCYSLQFLKLSNNQFQGKIFPEHANLTALEYMYLDGNRFSGNLGKGLLNSKGISVLDISENSISGVLPLWIGRFSVLPYQESKVYRFDLSSNQLSGEIPVMIGNLKDIRSLNLSSNHLTGSIPDSISKLENLDSLDLSNNKLDGNIPPQLADLNNLGYFNVSYNNFSGEIPFKGHFITFDERSYIGNVHLCGRPTNNSCNPVSEQSASNQAKEEDEESDNVLDMAWFYWSCGAVYITTILTMFVFLFIDSSWSRRWFYWVDLFIHYLLGLKGRFV